MNTQNANPQDSLQRLVGGTELEPRSCSERAPARSGVGGGTIKRYWSTLTPMQMERMTKDEIIKAKEFDAKLTPEDVLEMQTIDADCNDCRHFKRGPMRKGLGIACFEGRCGKLDKPTLAWPMQYSGHECFEHRRAPVSSGGGGAEQVPR